MTNALTPVRPTHKCKLEGCILARVRVVQDDDVAYREFIEGCSYCGAEVEEG